MVNNALTMRASATPPGELPQNEPAGLCLLLVTIFVGPSCAMERVETPPSIAAAIRRSKEARAALRSRRRRTAAIIAGLCLATAVPLALSFADSSAGDMVQAAVAKAHSLADLLDRRSPGQRTTAQLTKSKHQQVALAKMRPALRKPSVDAFVPLTSTPTEVASLVMPATPVVPTALGQIDIGPPPSIGTIVALPGGGVIVAPPGAGGGDTPGGGPPVINPTEAREPVIVPPPVINPTETREPVIVTSPVPEPATWLTMLLGFGLIGWQIRRGKRPGVTGQAA